MRTMTKMMLAKLLWSVRGEIAFAVSAQSCVALGLSLPETICFYPDQMLFFL